MDGDDVAYPERLERQIDYLHAASRGRPRRRLGDRVREKGEPIGKRGGAENHDQICARPHAGFPLIHPTYLGRIDFFRRHRYRASRRREKAAPRSRTAARGWPGLKTRTLLIRSYESSRFANVPEILLGYREGSLELKKMLGSRYGLVKSLWFERRGSRGCRGLAGERGAGAQGPIRCDRRLDRAQLPPPAAPGLAGDRGGARALAGRLDGAARTALSVVRSPSRAEWTRGGSAMAVVGRPGSFTSRPCRRRSPSSAARWVT